MFITKIVRNLGSVRACFNIGSVSSLTLEERQQMLFWLCAETFEPLKTGDYPNWGEGTYVEIGPRLTVETPDSSNHVAICHAMGLKKVVRVEVSYLFPVTAGTTREDILARHLDKMTQETYPHGGMSDFGVGAQPADVQLIPVLEQGEAAIRAASKQLGLGMDDFDVALYTKLFQRYGRNPTDVELLQIGNANSDHSRHWFFRGKQVIDGIVMERCLFDIVRAPLQAIRGPNVSVLAFNDNVGAILGHRVPVFAPISAGHPSAFRTILRVVHLTATMETHNHPTLIAPYPGAATGAGGRIRDNCAGGRGSLTGFGVAGYAVGNLFIPGYVIAGERVGGEIEEKHATPLRILIEGSNGVSDYGDEYGEPLILGYARTFCQVVSGARREYRKPILLSGGIGQIYGEHAKKRAPKKGMLIVAVGGPAFPIGVGGGAASSMMQGQNDAGLDFNSVQRGDGEMGHKAVEVIRACIEMGRRNPIESVHDQGAGGPSNVKTELMGKMGGKVDIRQIVLGDRSMSVLTIWSAEYQERYGFLIKPERLDEFRAICVRERVNCEVLGEVTGDGYVTVVDSANGTTPVHLNLEDIIGKLPQKTFRSDHLPKQLLPPILPGGLDLRGAIRIVLQQLSVCSKGFLVRKVDRSVGGRVARQQCCGASQLPIADVAVMADGYFGLTGVAGALGEQPLKMLIDPKAGARMAVAETLTNMMAAGGIKLGNVRCRANWMSPAKMPGEGAEQYDAAVAMSDFMIALGIAADGGKDSSSMAATVGGNLVKAPGTLVILGYAAMSDVTKVLSPDIKAPGESCLGLIDLGLWKNRLGGSALLQALDQLGDETPDCDPALLKATWKAVQLLHKRGLLISLHDRSDGGLAAAVIEMCLGGNCGAKVSGSFDLARLFSEELGLVIEYRPEDEAEIVAVLIGQEAAPFTRIAETEAIQPGEEDRVGVFGIGLATLRQWWEATSTELEKLQTANGVAEEEFANFAKVYRPVYKLGFTPSAPPAKKRRSRRPKVAVVREEGSNGHREMAAAFYTAGLEPYDVTMSDLLSGSITLDNFRGLVFPGGFSFKDVFDSAKGWAGVIRFNPGLRAMFDRFYNRSDTFTLGVCNGCQLSALLGWVPWRGIDETIQPRFVRNRSERFESRWVQVKIQPSPSILLAGMAGSTLGVHIAHGEGRLIFPDQATLATVLEQHLAPLAFVDEEDQPTEKYPFNPNGSPQGITALCSPDGRHLSMMPHPERAFRPLQCHYQPPEWQKLGVSPWLEMFQNARRWCEKNR